MKIVLLMLFLALILALTGCVSMRDQNVLDTYQTYLTQQVHDGKMTQAEADYRLADKKSELHGRHHNHMHTFFNAGGTIIET